MNFERNIAEIESIIAEMEDKKTSLDRSLELFDKGVALARECGAILEEGKGRVEKLSEELKARRD